MIKEYEYLHGVVFSRLCSVSEIAFSIAPFKKERYSAYTLNNKAGLYIKYSGKRLTPWKFTLAQSHQNEILEMYNKFGEVFIALVCYLDGVVLLNFKELKAILDDQHGDSEWISISRRRNEMYSVSASNRKLGFKISKASCPDKIVNYFKK
jgi:hypothetical protein